MLKQIENEDQFEYALARIYDLMQTTIVEDSPAADELDALATLVELYEREHYPIRPIEDGPAD